MIILQNKKNRIYLAALLSVLTLAFIVVAWQRLSPYSQAAKTEDQQELTSEEKATVPFIKELQNSFELGKLQWQALQRQLIKTDQQRKLFEAAQEYLKNKASSTPTSTATTSIE